MDTNSLSQSLDSVNTAVSVAGEEEVSVSLALATTTDSGQEIFIGFWSLTNKLSKNIFVNE